MTKISDEAFVTLATTDNYAIGALTLAQSLKSVNTNRQLCIMISKNLSESMRFENFLLRKHKIYRFLFLEMLLIAFSIMLN
jgi:hypothetical protein